MTNIIATEDNTANSVGTLQASNWNQSQATSGVRMIQVTQPVRISSHMYLKRPQTVGDDIKIRTKANKSINLSLNSEGIKDNTQKNIPRKKTKFFMKRS